MSSEEDEGNQDFWSVLQGSDLINMMQQWFHLQMEIEFKMATVCRGYLGGQKLHFMQIANFCLF